MSPLYNIVPRHKEDFLKRVLLLLLFITSYSCIGNTKHGYYQPKISSTNLPIPTHTQIPTQTPTITRTSIPSIESNPTQTIIITPTFTTSVIRNKISPKDGMELVFVPSGEFEMGSNEWNEDEKPVHTVYLDAYWIDKYEVTNTQYAIFLNEVGNQMEGGVTWLDASDEDVRIYQFGGEWLADSKYSNHPVVEVSWYGASAYCEWAGRRLPTEAEWEKAARGEDGRMYPWGNETDSSLGDYYGKARGTKPIGSYPAGVSPYGALDMAGNVWEWVFDWYDETYYRNSPYKNPQGPTSESFHVLRGGAWGLGVIYLRSSFRYWHSPVDLSSYYVGFRCVFSP